MDVPLDAPVDAAPPATGPRAWATGAMLVAVVLAWGNGLLVRVVTADLPFLGEAEDPSGYRLAAGAGLMTALLLILGLVALRALSAPLWLQYVAAAGVATQLALGITAWWSSRDVDETAAVTSSAWDGARDVLLSPASWPLLVLVVAAVVRRVRGRSSRAPR